MGRRGAPSLRVAKQIKKGLSAKRRVKDLATRDKGVPKHRYIRTCISMTQSWQVDHLVRNDGKMSEMSESSPTLSPPYSPFVEGLGDGSCSIASMSRDVFDQPIPREVSQC